MPVGVGEPAGNVSVAVSVNDWPSVRVALETCVEMPGVAGLTTTCSLASPHRPETAA